MCIRDSYPGEPGENLLPGYLVSHGVSLLRRTHDVRNARALLRLGPTGRPHRDERALTAKAVALFAFEWLFRQKLGENAGDGGVIVNTASVQGLQSMKGVPAYAASKGGILSLTRQMALEYAEQKLRVLAVNPGTIDTPLVEEAAGAIGGDYEALKREWGKSHPLQRIGKASEIAAAVLFLASDRASFMTGEYVNVDGGMMAMGAWANV